MIDWSRVNELRDEVGAEDFDEVVELFLEEVEECLTRLDHAQDASQLEAELHFLKGSALNLGFSAFAELCQDGESKAALGDIATINVDAVKEAFSQSKSTFDQSLASKVA